VVFVGHGLALLQGRKTRRRRKRGRAVRTTEATTNSEARANGDVRSLSQVPPVSALGPSFQGCDKVIPLMDKNFSILFLLFSVVHGGK